MSELLEALILGIVQGLTEFLPVSSSGHLEIAKVLLKDDALAEQSLFTTVLLHFATALSTLIVFRKMILKILKGLFTKDINQDKRFVLFVVISMIPAAIVGLFFDDLIASIFNQNLNLVAGMLIVTAVLLFLADKKYNEGQSLSAGKAIVIGLAQAVAVLPGISRSGATISSGLMLGLKREEAASFSFIMVIPLIFGKIAKDLLDGSFLENMPSVSYSLVGFFAAFISGIIACNWMIALVKKTGLKYFAIYCILVASAILIYSNL